MTTKNTNSKKTSKTVPIVISIPSKPKKYQSTIPISTIIGKINIKNFFIS